MRALEEANPLRGDWGVDCASLAALVAAAAGPLGTVTAKHGPMVHDAASLPDRGGLDRVGDAAMGGMDAVFVHVPYWSAGRREIMVMPLGLPALCNLLVDTGREAVIVHLGIEREIDPKFALGSWLQAAQPKMVLLSWHWHQQTRPVIALGERVRTWLPEARIYFGGLTASVFAREAMEHLPFLDGVVRGDGKEPLLALARAVLDGTCKLADF